MYLALSKKRKFLSFLVYAVIILNTLYLILNTEKAQAQTMSNKDYIINTQILNADPNITSVPAKEGTVNIKIKSEFENDAASLPFSISLSSDIVDFGILAPTNPIIRTVDLSVNNIPFYGYSVLVFENNALKNNQTFIPDTTCDNGQCSTENAAEWTNALTYGFGYRCDNVNGVDCDSAFASPKSYKHFPNTASNDDPQSIMSGIDSSNKKTRISYKVNISGAQAQDIYTNIITYIAVPNF